MAPGPPSRHPSLALSRHLHVARRGNSARRGFGISGWLETLSAAMDSFLRDDSLKRLDQRREVLLHRLPDDVQVDTEVRVHEPISHGYDLLPRNARRPDRVSSVI